jgi:glutathione peroxidase
MMNIWIMAVSMVCMSMVLSAKAEDKPAVPPALNFKMDSLEGESVDLSKYLGKVVLMVNTASKCGFTGQYKQLQAIHEKYAEKGLAVLGFPCNQFGGQEPGSPEEIQQFCSATYGVTFPMSAKLDVNGAGRHPLYAWLTDPANGFPGDIQWNFEKFLIGRDGRVLRRYPPMTRPEDKGLLQDIADAL